MMIFFNYGSKLLDKPYNPNGRFSRLSFAAWSFLNLMMSSISILLILIVSIQFHETKFAKFIGFITLLLMLFIQLNFIYYSFIFTIRRLHDCNLSGWISLILLVPILNFLLFFYLLYRKGGEGMNKYGFTRPMFGWEKFLGQAYMVIAPLIIITIIVSIMSSQDPKFHFKQMIFPNTIQQNSTHEFN